MSRKGQSWKQSGLGGRRNRTKSIVSGEGRGERWFFFFFLVFGYFGLNVNGGEGRVFVST